MTPRVLVVDDDEAILESLGRGLRLTGFEVETVNTPEKALESIAKSPPDAVVLDISMPGMSGVEVCRRIRSAGLDTPVCMLSALGDVDHRVEGLRAGGDDYLVKPFALEELRLRLEALLRRTGAVVKDASVLRVGPLEVDTAGRRASVAGQQLDLTRREFDLLELLARNRNIVLSRTQLLADVWGYNFPVDTNVVAVFISYLRRKIGDVSDVELIHTVRGVGFVMRE